MSDLEQLNREVAERVMGWEICHPTGEQDGLAVSRGTSEYLWIKPPSWLITKKLYSPATDIAAAFEVADKLVRFQLSRCDCGGPWSCRSAFNDAVEAETAPMAICLAALRAKGIEWKRGAETSALA